MDSNSMAEKSWSLVFTDKRSKKIMLNSLNPPPPPSSSSKKNKMHQKLRETLQEIEDDDILKQLIGWFQDLIDGTIGQELETRALQGLRLTHARKGFLRSEFAVPSLAADVDGNWHGGAIVSLMDAVGAVAVYSAFHHVVKSVDFSISHYSTAKIQDEVVVEAKVVGNHGKIVQVRMEARMKGNGELIAVGKMWVALNNFTVTTASKL